MGLLNRFSSLLECTSETTWQDALFQLGNEFGFEKTLIAAVPGRSTPLDSAFLRSNYSMQWRNKYDGQQWVNIDPTVAHCATRSTPLIWRTAIFAEKKQKEMYEEAISYGLCSGISLPFHGANGELGILCFVNDAKPDERFQQHAMHVMPALSMLRDFAFEASLRFMKPSNLEIPPALTAREVECLKWCAAGKSTWEMAQILGCAESSINFHFSNLHRKFKTTSRS
jgi:LuxR family quorum-sensing transcriptional regulator LasR